MPLPANNNNKESFRLLDLSSDVSSEDLQLEIAPAKKKKLQRKGRIRGGGGARNDVPVPTTWSQWRLSLRYAGYLTALAWLLMLTYAVCTLNERLGGLDNRLQTVSTGSDGVSDALQQCHSTAQELRANTSALAARLATLTVEHDALALNYTSTAAELGKLQAKLADMPDLINSPIHLNDLVKMVGDLGSRLSGVDVAIKAAQETAAAAKLGLDELKMAVNQTSMAANASSVERKETAERLRKIGDGIEALNETIAKRLNATEEKLKEYATQLTSDAAAIAELHSRLPTPPPATTLLPATSAASVVTSSPPSPPPVQKPAEQPPQPASVPPAASASPAATTTLLPSTSTQSAVHAKPAILQSHT